MKFDEWKSVIIVLIVVQLDVGLCKRIRVKRISSYAIWINYVYYFSSYYSFRKIGFNYIELLQSLLSIRCQVSMEFWTNIRNNTHNWFFCKFPISLEAANLSWTSSTAYGWKNTRLSFWNRSFVFESTTKGRYCGTRWCNFRTTESQGIFFFIGIFFCCGG